MAATASRVLREVEYLKKKTELLKVILKQKEEWEMKEHLLEQSRVIKEEHFSEDIETMKIKAMGTTTTRAKPRRPRKKKDHTPYAEVDPVNVEVSKSEDELENEFVGKRKCYRILSMMLKHEFAAPFSKPVDHVALRLLDYPQIIKNPMDLGTIKEQLKDGTIKDYEEYVAKMRLTFKNAKIYNPRHNIIHQWAVQLEKVFERKLSTVDRAQIQDLKKEHEKAKRAQQIEAHERERERQRAKRAEYRERKSKEVTNPYASLPSAKRRKTNPLPQKPFTKKQIVAPEVFDEEAQEELQLMISDLSGEKLQGLLEILDVDGSGENIQLDLDVLSTTQLRDMFIYCKQQLGWNSRRPAKRQQKRNALERELSDLQKSESPEVEEPKDTIEEEIDITPQFYRF